MCAVKKRIKCWSTFNGFKVVSSNINQANVQQEEKVKLYNEKEVTQKRQRQEWQKGVERRGQGEGAAGSQRRIKSGGCDRREAVRMVKK